MDNPVKNYTDKHGRQITIDGDGIKMVAEHNGKQIGLFDFDELDDCTILTYCNIDINYQRAGIGIAMIKLAEEWYSEFCIVDHFSTEGDAFFNYCKQNVFKLKHPAIKDDRF